MLTREEIERRKPLWAALSDLWLADYEFEQRDENKLKKEILSNLHERSELDTAFAALGNYDSHVVRAMIASGYPLSEIESIFCEEVAPVVYSNSYKPYGGEWGGFDSEWLYGAILENLEKQQSNPIYRTWVKSTPGKFVMTKMVRDDWEKIVKLYESFQQK